MNRKDCDQLDQDLNCLAYQVDMIRDIAYDAASRSIDLITAKIEEMRFRIQHGGHTLKEVNRIEVKEEIDLGKKLEQCKNEEERAYAIEQMRTKRSARNAKWERMSR